MKVFIVGEDPVTIEVVKKILIHCSEKSFEIVSELPSRGGEIKNKIQEFNQLSLVTPVILLTDLDSYNCAPEMLGKLVPNKNSNFIFNIAVDEAEAWLMADRKGFSKYFSIQEELLPEAKLKKQGGMNPLIEMDFDYKSSMFLTYILASQSSNVSIKAAFSPKKGAKKGPEYNMTMIPFIVNEWNIEDARKNSDSLNRMICRLENL